MRRAPALLLLPALLAGCGQEDPRAEVRERTAVVLQAAADGDADALREGLAELATAAQRAELPAEQRQRIVDLAQAAAARADLVDADLQARLAAEAEAERVRRELEAAQAQLAEQQAREAEAARQAEQDRGKGEDKDSGKDDDKDDD